MRGIPLDRLSYVGGSDARTILGEDQKALLRLWQEKRGELAPEDLSGNLLVQFGGATEELNRRWFERETGHSIGAVQRFVRHPKLDWMGATLDGIVPGLPLDPHRRGEVGLHGGRGRPRLPDRPVAG